MDVLFCRVPFMKNYCGVENNFKNNDIISKFYHEKKGSSPESYLFQDYNGSCYGYISVKDGVVDLDKIKFKNSEELLFKNAIVVFLYFDKNINENIILGWYKNANVYKFLQKKISYPSIGRDLYFNIKSDAKNCFLLPIKNRNFKLHIEFNNKNVFIPQSVDKKLVKEALNYIENYSKGFINMHFNDKTLNITLENPVNNPITLSKRGYIYLYNEGNFYEALKFFNTALLFKEKLSLKEIIDIEYLKGLCFQFLNAFSFAQTQFEKVISLNAGNLQIYKNLAYLYVINAEYKKALNICDEILYEDDEINKNSNLKTEIKCIKIDALVGMNSFNDLKNLLKEVLKETSDPLLKSHCEKFLKEMEF